jgi:hypothetical protein
VSYRAALGSGASHRVVAVPGARFPQRRLDSEDLTHPVVVGDLVEGDLAVEHREPGLVGQQLVYVIACLPLVANSGQ